MVSTVSSRRRWMNTERPSPEMAIGSRRVSAGVRSDVRLRISRDCRFKTKGRGGPPVSAGSPKTAISSPSGKTRTLGESVYRTVAGRTWVRPESGQKRSNCSRPSAEWRPAMSEPSGSGSASQEFSRTEEHTSELQSLRHLVCRLLLEKKKTTNIILSKALTRHTEHQPHLKSLMQ